MQSDMLRGTMDSKPKLPRKMRKVLVEKKRRERIESCLQDIKQLLFQGAQYQKMEKAEILEGVVKHLEYSCKVTGRTTITPERTSPQPEAEYRLGYLHCMKEVTSVLQHVQGTSASPLAMSITQYLHNKVNNMTAISTQCQDKLYVPVQNSTNCREVHANSRGFHVYKREATPTDSNVSHNQLCDSYQTLRDNIQIINKANSCDSNQVVCDEMNISSDHVVPGNENIQENALDFMKSSSMKCKENVMKVENEAMWRPW